MTKPNKNNSAKKNFATRSVAELTDNEFDLEISEAEKNKITFDATWDFVRS